MPKFNYVALDARGQESTGMLEAGTSNEVVAHLRQSGFFPTSVVEEGKGGAPKAAKGKGKAIQAASKSPAKKGAGGYKKGKVKTKVLMIFTRQLATLIDAGLPLLRGLNVLAKQEKDPMLKGTINHLAEAVQGGSTFSESLAQHPKIFNKLYINMVKAGELGGVLELVLNRLAEFQEKAQKIKNKVVAAMFYPIIVLFIAIAIMGFLLVFIVPKFQAIFQDMGATLPRSYLVCDRSKQCSQGSYSPRSWIDCRDYCRLQSFRKHSRRARGSGPGQTKNAAVWRPGPQKRHLPFQPHLGHFGDKRRADFAGVEHHT